MKDKSEIPRSHIKLLDLKNPRSTVKRLRIGEVSIYFSYQTPIALHDGMTNTLYYTDEYFSVTTSKHQNEIKSSIKPPPETTALSFSALELKIAERLKDFYAHEAPFLSHYFAARQA